MKIRGVIVSMEKPNKGVYRMVLRNDSTLDKVYVVGSRHIDECGIVVGDSVWKDEYDTYMVLMHISNDSVVCETKYRIR